MIGYSVVHRGIEPGTSRTKLSQIAPFPFPDGVQLCSFCKRSPCYGGYVSPSVTCNRLLALHTTVYRSTEAHVAESIKTHNSPSDILQLSRYSYTIVSGNLIQFLSSRVWLEWAGKVHRVYPELLANKWFQFNERAYQLMTDVSGFRLTSRKTGQC
jgi:hypothetical protein